MPAMATATMLRIITGDGNTIPRWSCERAEKRATMSDLEAEATRRACPLALRAHPAQAAHQQRVLGQGLGTIDEGVEHLVVAGGRHVEGLADRGLLGAGVLPPLALELEDLAVAVAQAGSGIAARLCGGVHPCLPSWRRCRH